MNERKIRIILISIGIFAWIVLAVHSYHSLWHSKPPVYQNMSNPGELLMHVKGEVMNPGLYSFDAGDTYEDIISSAGGFTEVADASSLDLSAPCVDGTELTVPKLKQEDSTPQKSNSGKKNSDSKAEVILPLDINQASKEELCALSGIGEVLAGRIVDYRTENGPFTLIDDLLNVSGIGEKKLEAIRNDVYILTE